jgi:hypothetical protein
MPIKIAMFFRNPESGAAVIEDLRCQCIARRWKLAAVRIDGGPEHDARTNIETAADCQIGSAMAFAAQSWELLGGVPHPEASERVRWFYDVALSSLELAEDLLRGEDAAREAAQKAKENEDA